MAIIDAPTAADRTEPEPFERLTSPFVRFARTSSAGGIVLLACTIVAMVWANSSGAEAYHRFFHVDELVVRFRSFVLAKPLSLWINDALMAVFFFVVGLEIKREILAGELGSLRKAALPIAAAVGGVVVPAILYTAFNGGRATARGWGVPMATDIAFALGMLSLLGSRVPAGLKVFLTSLAIADDIVALLVITFFYTESIAVGYLAAAAAVAGGMFLMGAIRVRIPLAYLLVGMVLWYLVYKSGVHATVAGVVAAVAIPAKARVGPKAFLDVTREAVERFARASERGGAGLDTNASQRAAIATIHASSRQVMPMLLRLEGALHPWSAFFIVPVFALANAGVEMTGEIGATLTSPVTLGVVVGLVLGKPVGIVVASALAVRAGLASLPSGVTWRHLIGTGFLGGIGFTMALFIAGLAFADAPEQLVAAKVGVLVASAAAAVVGLAILATGPAAGSGRDRLDNL